MVIRCVSWLLLQPLAACTKNMSDVYQRTTFSAVDAATFCFPCMLQVGIDIPSQQMMTVKIMSKGVKQDEFIGVVVVPVSRLMSGKYTCPV